MLRKIISGGQTGVDRAALDAAMGQGLACGGWCPKYRRSENGRIPDRYPLRERDSPAYADRTRANVQDAQGTLVLHRGTLSGGTALTVDLARRSGKPCRIIDLDRPPAPREIADWIRESRIEVLNVAGPRESGSPGIYHMARVYLQQVIVCAMSGIRT